MRTRSSRSTKPISGRAASSRRATHKLNLQADLVVGVAALLGSAINAGAGGGSFISFPVLLATGVAPVPASATNNVAMWLGAFASTGSFRSQIEISRAALYKMLAASVAGSIVGAVLLLRTSNAAFASLVPLLLFVATAIFIAGPTLARRSQRMTAALTIESPLGLLAQFAIAVYGGFFGAAMGILMLALLGILGMHDVRRANAFKMLLSTIINGVAVIPFVIARAIAWEPAIAMSVASIAGGYLGARVVKIMPSQAIRAFVIVVAVTMTVYFTWKTYIARA